MAARHERVQSHRKPKNTSPAALWLLTHSWEKIKEKRPHSRRGGGGGKRTRPTTTETTQGGGGGTASH
eukprot:3156620-Pyramimonas_sp.AAC.1